MSTIAFRIRLPRFLKLTNGCIGDLSKCLMGIVHILHYAGAVAFLELAQDLFRRVDTIASILNITIITRYRRYDRTNLIVRERFGIRGSDFADVQQRIDRMIRVVVSDSR